MRIISSFECHHISGSITTPQKMFVGFSFIVGGMLSGMIAFNLRPVFSIVGVPAGAVALGGLCSSFSPFVGSLGCGIAGGVLGYQYGAELGFAAASYAGGALSAYLVYNKVLK